MAGLLNFKQSMIHGDYFIKGCSNCTEVRDQLNGGPFDISNRPDFQTYSTCLFFQALSLDPPFNNGSRRATKSDHDYLHKETVISLALHLSPLQLLLKDDDYIATLLCPVDFSILT